MKGVPFFLFPSSYTTYCIYILVCENDFSIIFILTLTGYLAVNHCEASVFSLVDEMPILKVHIPAKPPRVSNADYLRHLSRSSVNLGLKEMLTDYMNAKFLGDFYLELRSYNLIHIYSKQ